MKVPSHIRRTHRKAAEGLYAVPPRGYPIGDLYHARLALIYVMSRSNAAKRKRVMRAVADAYPQYDWAKWWNKEVRDIAAPSWQSAIGSRRKIAANPRRRNMSDYHRGCVKAEDDFDRSMEPGFETKTRSELVRAGKSPEYVRGYLKQIKEEEREFDLALPAMRESSNPRRRNTMARRNYGRIKILENPYGMKLGGGHDAVRYGTGDRVHIAMGGGTMCNAAAKGVRSSKARVVTCYRCLKLLNMNAGHTSNAAFPHRKAGRDANTVVPGGRKGHWIAALEDHRNMDIDSIAGRGDEEYPSQARGTISFIEREERAAKARRKTRAKTRQTKKAGKKKAGKKAGKRARANPRRRR